MSDFVPVNEPVVPASAKKYVNDALDTGWISSAGAYIGKFEEAFANTIGVKHAILTTSGTTALHLALEALEVGPDDEVILPDFTMIASVFAVMYTGAKPVFCDVEPDTYNMDPNKLEEKITPKTKAIMPVHIYGHSCDMDPILEIAAKHGISVVEDAAEIHGGTYKGKMCGSLGNISAFSFYGNKIISTGEGGMVCTDDDELAERVRSLKDLSHSKQKRFVHEKLGYNYRVTNLQAALGLGQLEHLEEFLKTKEHMANFYTERLQGIKGIRTPITKDYAKNVYWMYAILIEDEFGMSRDEFAAKLKEQGVDTRTFFVPCHEQPAVSELYPTEETFPVTEYVAERGLYLPSGLAITDEQMERVCDVIESVAV
ncbi:DegT/DnrJ/EryC1/StrS family aminotransferase [Patescibacteria group bacterium]|nr:DegT/DnrJ/EryC1/StrS family aminotransferase [Patescibacteria group bacterium]